ncbi:MAG TPA: YXWGXW repeat-containing protein [Opitutaceae bacterium]|nr:YXWGXW repeat-containing protein [Opitutaceae bacterium]
MKIPSTLIFASILAAFNAGCVGTGPNTQQGAVAGGAIGALAGAIIGNNSGHRTLEGAAIGGAVGAVAGGTIGNSIDQQRGTIYGSRTEAATNVVVQEVPPPPQPQSEVIVVQPSPAAVWIPGYWAYEGRGYVWVAGYWTVPPPHRHHFVQPHWERDRGGYVYIRGYWR